MKISPKLLLLFLPLVVAVLLTKSPYLHVKSVQADNTPSLTFDTRTFFPGPNDSINETVTAYGRIWNWDSSGLILPGFPDGANLSSIERYQTGPCLDPVTNTQHIPCIFDTRTYLTDPNSKQVTESVTAYGKFWNWYSDGTPWPGSPVAGSDLSSISRYASGPCAVNPDPNTACKFDTRTFLNDPNTNDFTESITAYGKFWNWYSDGTPWPGSPVAGSDLSSVDRYNKGPCLLDPVTGTQHVPCTFDTRTFLNDPNTGVFTESVTAYGHAWNWSFSGSSPTPWPGNGFELSSVPRYKVIGPAPSCDPNTEGDSNGKADMADLTRWVEEASGVSSTKTANCDNNDVVNILDYNIIHNEVYNYPAPTSVPTSIPTIAPTAFPTPTNVPVPSPFATPADTPTPTTAPTAVPTPTPVAELLDENFESGLGSWNQPQDPSPKVMLPSSISTYPGGGTSEHALLLGTPDYNLLCNGNIPGGDSRGRVTREVSLPNVSNLKISFSYRVFSQDSLVNPANGLAQDSFLFSVGGTTLLEDGAPTVSGCDVQPWDSGWKTVQISLNQYGGQTIQLNFIVWNRMHAFYNTYAYVDNIKITR